MKDRGFPSFDDGMVLVKGEIDPRGVPVYAVVRNEMYFLPAFLEHYRQLGVRQFAFLDDKSDDGTLEYLLEQPDCVVLGSQRRYGEPIDGRRVDVVWKSQIPHRFLPGRWAICVDADEFLFLPPRFRTVDEAVAALDRRGTTAVPAVMVDFYPAAIEDMASLRAPTDRDELFAACPWFDAGPYFDWEAGRLLPGNPRGGVRARLLKRYRISRRQESKPPLKRLWKAIRGRRRYGPWVAKVPLVKWSPDRFYHNSHALNVAPDTSMMLPIAHFKLTGNFAAKIREALRTKAHVMGSVEYEEYAELVRVLSERKEGFLGACSVKFTGSQDFCKHGLMHFE